MLVIVVVCILRVSESRDTFVVCSVMFINTVCRIPSAFPELKPYATYLHQLVKATSFIAYKRNCQGTCRANFYRNFDFTKMTSKFGENWLMKCIVVFSFWGGAPRPPDQGLCPWTPLGAQPPDPHYRLALPRSQ